MLARISAAARAAGFELDIAGPHDVVLDSAGHVIVFGAEVEPGTALFHVKPLRFPPYAMDHAVGIDLLRALRTLGHLTTCRPSSVDLTNDKWGTLLWASRLGFETLQTFKVHPRATTPRDLSVIRMNGPYLVKPNSWGGGNGIVAVRDRTDLERVLRLFEGHDSVIIQPLLEPAPRDVRVYCANGEPVRAMARIPLRGKLVSNYYMGGAFEEYPIDSALADDSRQIAEAIDESYVCVDWMVCANGQRVFGEVELDGGAIGPDPSLEQLRFHAWARQVGG
jgi:glutathione synthase/RimK-type ligase-like ATP-grasp enzyme